MMRSMTNTMSTTKRPRRTQAERWARNLAALDAYIAEHGDALVPAAHVQMIGDESVSLGPWVGYVRQRYRHGNLAPERAAALSERQGWEWGPLRPGPSADAHRNDEIRVLRSQGWTLRSLAERFNLSRQRIYQIAPESPASPSTDTVE